MSSGTAARADTPNIETRELCVVIDTVNTIAVGVFEVTSDLTTLLRVEQRDGTEIDPGTGAGQYTIADQSLCDCDTPKI